MLEICFKCKRERKNNSYTERTEAQMSFDSENDEKCKRDENIAASSGFMDLWIYGIKESWIQGTRDLGSDFRRQKIEWIRQNITQKRRPLEIRKFMNA